MTESYDGRRITRLMKGLYCVVVAGALTTGAGVFYGTILEPNIPPVLAKYFQVERLRDDERGTNLRDFEAGFPRSVDLRERELIY